jgi:hypothetical protein
MGGAGEIFAPRATELFAGAELPEPNAVEWVPVVVGLGGGSVAPPWAWQLFVPSDA